MTKTGKIATSAENANLPRIPIKTFLSKPGNISGNRAHSSILQIMPELTAQNGFERFELQRG